MQGTQSIERAIQILRLFDDEKPDWTLIELIEATGLKKTTVFRMLTTLKHEGFLDQIDTGTWCLGSELIMLGGRSMRRHRFRAVANDEMRRVARETGESATIDVFWIDGDDAPFSMVIDECLGHHLLGMTQYIGVRLPAHATSTGKVLLAHLPKTQLNTFNLKDLPALTSHTTVDPKVLKKELTNIRKRGYSTTINELEVGIIGLAVPIFNHHSEVIAALSVAGPASRISAEKLEKFFPILSRAAAAISQKIGHRASSAP